MNVYIFVDPELVSHLSEMARREFRTPRRQIEYLIDRTLREAGAVVEEAEARATSEATAVVSR